MKEEMNWVDVSKKENEMNDYFDSIEKNRKYDDWYIVGVKSEYQCPECSYLGCLCELHREDY